MREQLLLKMLKEASRDKPVTRRMIARTFRISDRSARGMVENLREQGFRINGTSKDKGYWFITTEKEYARFRRDYTSKADTIYRRTDNMDKQSNGEQVTMDGIL